MIMNRNSAPVIEFMVKQYVWESNLALNIWYDINDRIFA